ncbi:MAG: LacI family DNA-binding transcriptional regulator [Wenzhouxiangellaceae bacterium]|nr:LacI family DNA-binding transcriptional regulator [Wenzhouxiangellaceae bacterium]
MAEEPRQQAIRTMSDLARLAGVSESTVSRALAGSELVAARTRERIMELARVTHFVANEQARSLALGKVRVIEVIFTIEHGTLQRVSDPFFIEMLAMLIDEFSGHGFDVLVSHATPWDEEHPECAYVSGRAAGLVIIGQARQRTAIAEFARHHPNVVIWGALEDEQDDRQTLVGSNNRCGGERVTRHLLDCGRRAIAFLGDTRLPEIRQRFEGYSEALSAAGITPNPELVLPAPFDIERARQAASALPDLYPAFDAVFAASDMIALAVIKTLQDQGLRVPEDVAVVGFDDIPAAAHMYPGLTTVRQNVPEAARVLAASLLARMDGRSAPSTAIDVELVVRETCGSGLRQRNRRAS